MNQPGGERTGRFISRLLMLGEQKAGGREAGQRASLAELRRGLGRPPGAAPGAYREVLTLLDGRGAGDRFEDACFQVATLYALYPHNSGTPRSGEQRRDRNLGHSLGFLSRKDERKQGAGRRMIALLNCHEDDLPEHLRHAVSLLRADDGPIDWRQLLRDLRGWPDDDRHVQRAWARGFWGSGEEAPTDTTGDTSTTGTNADGPVTAAKEREDAN